MDEGEELSEETLANVFARLKPYSISLLDLVRNPSRQKGSASFLSEMAAFLRQAPPAALQSCFDYTLFPLLLLLDSAVECRKGRKFESGDSNADLAISDSVAEGVLMCLESLLSKCNVGSVNQMVTIMKKLTSAAMLTHYEASEEFRIGTINSFRALLLRLKPCSNDSCSCKKTVLPHSSVQIIASNGEKTEVLTECLITFLRSPEASAALGHWLSLLLQMAESEASRGLIGSAELRKQSFLTLRVLVSKVGSADALAYFLPGIVSRFAKALYVSKSMISGPAGSAASTEQAILGLTESLTIVLSDQENLREPGPSDTADTRSTEFIMDLLRNLPANTQSQSQSRSQTQLKKPVKDEVKNMSSFCVERTKEWIEETAENVDKSLSAAFPHLCVHPSGKVREALVHGIRDLLANCSYTLKKSKLLLLECLCVLACDDAINVSESARDSLGSLFTPGKNFLTASEISDIFTRLVEKLPRVVLGSDETEAISHARRLLALIFYSGPEILINYLVSSPANAVRIFDSIAVSISQGSQFSGSFNKLVSAKPLSAGYLFSMAELKSSACFRDNVSPAVSSISPVQDITGESITLSESNRSGYELPHVPPWFVNAGTQKLYSALAQILRLIGLSTVAGQKSGLNLPVLVDMVLDKFRNLTSEIQSKDFDWDELQSWYLQTGSGQILRQTSASVCMLNEMIYGLSDQSFNSLFVKESTTVHTRAWIIKDKESTRDQIVHCIGSILHEYMSQEVWDLPVSQIELDLPLHLLRDVTALHQVLIEGIGIFVMVLKEDFVRSGFMHSSLYLLLRKLISASSQIRVVSDAVLRVLSLSSGHASVGEFVVANADYIVDSLCRQLRHLYLNPHVPDILSSILSYIGASHEILPLLDEPMRAVSSELEVLGRQEHPNLTVPFLKAVREIAKACRFESLDLPKESESFFEDINPKVHVVQSIVLDRHRESIHISGKTEEWQSNEKKEEYESIIYWEQLRHMLIMRKEYRRIVGSLSGSCLISSFPLLSSLNESVCLLSLDIVEEAVEAIAKVEETYKYEKKTNAKINRAIILLGTGELSDDELDDHDDSDENRLLPAMNKLWPFFVTCLNNKISVAVVKKCTKVISKSIQISGGDFFTRRFQTDGPAFWKLLTLSPFCRKPVPSSVERSLILLPYRSNPLSSSSEQPMAEISSQKIQSALLEMITDLSSDKRSASALETVLKRVSGIVVSIACSTMSGLRENAIRALLGLSCIDSDLVWLLVADVYYSLNRKGLPLMPDPGLLEVSELLPPVTGLKVYLYVQYGGGNFGLDLDPSAVELVFRRLEAGQ